MNTHKLVHNRSTGQKKHMYDGGSKGHGIATILGQGSTIGWYLGFIFHWVLVRFQAVANLLFKWDRKAVASRSRAGFILLALQMVSTTSRTSGKQVFYLLIISGQGNSKGQSNWQKELALQDNFLSYF